MEEPVLIASRVQADRNSASLCEWGKEADASSVALCVVLCCIQEP